MSLLPMQRRSQTVWVERIERVDECFSGGDGGVTVYRFRQRLLMPLIDSAATEGDEDRQEYRATPNGRARRLSGSHLTLVSRHSDNSSTMPTSSDAKPSETLGHLESVFVVFQRSRKGKRDIREYGAKMCRGYTDGPRVLKLLGRHVGSLRFRRNSSGRRAATSTSL